MVLGLSPRVRGNRVNLGVRCQRRGSIPACAGEPPSATRPSAATRVYPRVCGGTFLLRFHGLTLQGLSPRVRGNPLVGVKCAAYGGSIPACAGEPSATKPIPSMCRVYPRVCGGTRISPNNAVADYGLSPRVRGNPALEPQLHQANGSIPACAGEPKSSASTVRAPWVYPRVCGGTSMGVRRRETVKGLSPRVRGNLGPAPRRAATAGSIPACAGEPRPRAARPRRPGVYPRVCGGTSVRLERDNYRVGLSPRVRGNPTNSAPRRRANGSIPACAGEPLRWLGCIARRRVYPRVCGGTHAVGRLGSRSGGLSPRVRGNRAGVVGVSRSRGSIPACAGEPGVPATRHRMHGVYPRVCGGTRQTPCKPLHAPGLSPRVRGNPVELQQITQPLGSIPACAGEPTGRGRQGGGYGSIPACAGEPRARQPSRGRTRVYPRVCGGTRTSQRWAAGRRGLSPRVRGNLRSTPCRRRS